VEWGKRERKGEGRAGGEGGYGIAREDVWIGEVRGDDERYTLERILFFAQPSLSSARQMCGWE